MIKYWKEIKRKIKKANRVWGKTKKERIKLKRSSEIKN